MDFILPSYKEIPNVGLYLKQVVKLINDAVEPMLHTTVTETMLSNYVKKHLVANPVKKQYQRDQIAALLFIVIAKNVVSLDDIQLLLQMQNQDYDPETAYDYFCMEFRNVLEYVYGYKEMMERLGTSESEEKKLLRNIIVTVAHKMYVDDCFFRIREEKEEA